MNLGFFDQPQIPAVPNGTKLVRIRLGSCQIYVHIIYCRTNHCLPTFLRRNLLENGTRFFRRKPKGNILCRKWNVARFNPRSLKNVFTSGQTSGQPQKSLITLSESTVSCRYDLYFAWNYQYPTMRPVNLVITGAYETEMHYFQLHKMFSFNWIKGRLGSRLVHNLLNPFRYQNRWKLLRASISQLMLIKFIALELKATLRHFFARTFFSCQRFLSPTKWLRRKRKDVDGMSSESKFAFKIKISLHQQLIAL